MRAESLPRLAKAAVSAALLLCLLLLTLAAGAGSLVLAANDRLPLALAVFGSLLTVVALVLAFFRRMNWAHKLAVTVVLVAAVLALAPRPFGSSIPAEPRRQA